MQSSSGLDVTRTYGELGGMWRDLNATSAVLDGEIVVFTDDGRPSFEALQRHDTQVVFQAFDVLEIDGNDVTALPYEQRRALLAEALDAGDNWTVPGHRVGGGADLLAATAAEGLEGVMAKKLGSPYQVGKRSPNWRKVKNRVSVELIVGGYTRGTGNRSDTFGALLVGHPDDDTRRASDPLRFAGGVGTGFTQRRLEELLARVARRRDRRVPVRPAATARVPARRHLGATRAARTGRDRRVHQRRSRAPRQLHRAGRAALTPATIRGERRSEQLLAAELGHQPCGMSVGGDAHVVEPVERVHAGP